MKTSIPRLRRVRFKSGPSLEVLRQQFINDRNHLEKRMRGLMDVFFADRKRAGGFAFCIWDADGESVTGQAQFESGNIPKAMIPDYVRNLLILNSSRDW